MSDPELCWDPLMPDLTEKRSRRGYRKLKSGLKQMEMISEGRSEQEIEEIQKPWLKKQRIKEEKRMKKMYYKNLKENKHEILKYDKQTEKLDDLKALLGKSDPDSDENFARV